MFKESLHLKYFKNTEAAYNIQNIMNTIYDRKMMHKVV